MSELKFSLIGIYGGTFDPIHYGHLRIAEELTDIIGFQTIHFIPSGSPRLRRDPFASRYHRLMMARLAIKNNSKFILDAREINREGKSSSVESLREYKYESGDDKTALCFIIGIDAFMKLPLWYCWRELFTLCHFIIVHRPGRISMMNQDTLPQDLKKECASRWVTSANDLKRQSSGLVFAASTSLLDISATTIRSFLSAEKSARYLLPDAVLDYINIHHLYSGEK